MNYKIIDSIYKQIKKEQLLNFYQDTILTDYTFVPIGTLCDIDTTNYGSDYDLINFLKTSITPTLYDTDNTTICTSDSIMSILIGLDLSKLQIDDYTDKYVLAFFNFKDLMTTFDKIFIFNKVIGVD